MSHKPEFPHRRKQKIINKHYQVHEALIWIMASIILINLSLIAVSLGAGWNLLGSHPLRNGLMLAGIEAIVIWLSFYLSISHSHKVAGPVYALERELRRMGKGDLTQHLQFREGDQFFSSAEAFNGTRRSLCDQIRTIQDMADQLANAKIDNTEAQQLITQLRKQLGFFKTRNEEAEQ